MLLENILKSVVFPEAIIMCTWLILEVILSGTRSHFVLGYGATREMMGG